jgi:hypothetical protein
MIIVRKLILCDASPKKDSPTSIMQALSALPADALSFLAYTLASQEQRDLASVISLAHTCRDIKKSLSPTVRVSREEAGQLEKARSRTQEENLGSEINLFS